MVDQHHIFFPATPKGNMGSLSPLAHACLPPFEQFIEQQIVQLQDFILERLLYHTIFNMFSNKTFKAHRV